MARKISTEVKKITAQSNLVLEALYAALAGQPDYAAMTEAVSEEKARLASEEHPVIRAEFMLHSLRAIAREFNVQIEA